MMMKKKTYGTAGVALLLALALTGCVPGAPATEETNTPAPTETTVSTPTPAETVVPATPVDAVITERNANGSFTLPDGSEMNCPAESKGVVIEAGKEPACDTSYEVEF